MLREGLGKGSVSVTRLPVMATALQLGHVRAAGNALLPPSLPHNLRAWQATSHRHTFLSEVAFSLGSMVFFLFPLGK